MALNDSHRIIWLDAYIGQDGEYHSFRRMFCTTLDPNSQYGTEFDVLISALNANAVPFIFVDTSEKAIHEIEINHNKQIIFISSGSLGQQIIPEINSKYPYVYSYYIFCAIMSNYIDFALNYRDCLQIFTNELDLLVRLVRDISLELIGRGKRHLEEHDPERALDYFHRSHVLEETANKKDTLNGSFHEHLRMLDGYGGQQRLIKEAEIMKKQQDEERDEQQPEPYIPDNDSQGQEHGVIYALREERVSQEDDPQLTDQNSDLQIAQEVSVREEHEEEENESRNLRVVHQVSPTDQ